MKIQNQEQAEQAVEEILEQKNWTNLSFRELASAGRITIHSDIDSWVQYYYAENDMVYGGFFAERIAEILRHRIEHLAS